MLNHPAPRVPRGRRLGCRAAALLVSGGCAALGGQTLDAKQRLARALKLAHGPLGNHQLVAQVRQGSFQKLADLAPSAQLQKGSMRESGLRAEEEGAGTAAWESMEAHN